MMRCVPACLLIVLLGCSEAPKAELMPIEKVPENIMTIAREKLPGVKFDQAVKGSDGRIEVIGKDGKGKVREIEISPSGEILEIE
jgi:hypothetical protein